MEDLPVLLWGKRGELLARGRQLRGKRDGNCGLTRGGGRAGRLRARSTSYGCAGSNRGLRSTASGLTIVEADTVPGGRTVSRVSWPRSLTLGVRAAPTSQEFAGKRSLLVLLSDALQASVTATAANIQRLVVDRALFLGATTRGRRSMRRPRAAGSRVGATGIAVGEATFAG